MKKVAVILMALQLNFAWADNCAQPVTTLKKGDAAPCEGFLFSRDKEAEVKKKVQDGELANQQVEVQAKEIQLYQTQTQIYQDVATKYAAESELWRNKATDVTKQYVDSEHGSKLENVALFGGGVVVGIGLAYLASAIIKNVAK